MIFSAIALNGDRDWHVKGSLTYNWRYFYFNPMFFHNFFNNIQSQPAAFVSVFCGKEPLQGSRQNLRENHLTAIRDAQEQDRIFIYHAYC